MNRGAGPTSEAAGRQTGNGGLGALALLLRFHGIAADPGHLAHEAATDRPGAIDLVRLARRSGLKARLVTVTAKRIAVLPLPAMAEGRDGTFFVLAKISDGKALIQETGERPVIMAVADLDAILSGRFILLAKRAGLSDLGRRFDLSWFMAAVHKYRRLLGEVLVASFVLQVLALVSPLFFQVVVDKVLVHQSVSTLDVLLAGLVLVSLFEAVLGAVRTYLFAHTTSRIDVELGARLFRHLTGLPLGYFEVRRTGDSVARVRELEGIRSFLTGSALTLAIDLVFTVVFLIVMALYSVPLTLIVVVSVPVYVAISAGLTPLFKARLDEKFDRGSESQAFLVESINGIETLKSLAVEPQMQRRWEEQLAGYVQAAFCVVSLSNWGSQAVQLVGKLVTGAILYLGAHKVMEGDLSVGELVAFNMLAGRVAQPVLRLAQLWQDFQQARISVERLGDILNTPVEPSSGGRSALPAIKGAIRFEDVAFRYKSDAGLVLEGIDLDIPAGQVVGIVGPSGSGKSTLAKLIQRFHVPERGRVLVDGIDIGLVDAAALRRQIGVVLQENVLFNRTVRENVALSDPGLPLEEVMRAAVLAGAHEFISALPRGYDSEIGERGVGLSGGQRQRIAIARALIRNPRILILDEATSALDYESEEVVQRNLRAMAVGRTVIIIAHRLSAVRDCDRILTLENGRIAEDGTHAQLAAAGGRYAAMLRHQARSRVA